MYILLDIDNVILKNSYFDEKGNIQYFWTQNIEKDLGIKQSTLRFLFDDEWIDVLLGRILLNNKVSDFFNNINSKLSNEDFISYWLEHDSCLNQNVVSFINKMHEKGFKLCVGSNQEETRVNYLLKKHNDIFSLFEKIYISANLHKVKPNKEFFYEILKDLNTDVNNIIFIDDDCRNINSAKNIGIKTFEYKSINDSFDEIIKEINKL